MSNIRPAVISDQELDKLLTLIPDDFEQGRNLLHRLAASPRTPSPELPPWNLSAVARRLNHYLQPAAYIVGPEELAADFDEDPPRLRREWRWSIYRAEAA